MKRTTRRWEQQASEMQRSRLLHALNLGVIGRIFEPNIDMERGSRIAIYRKGDVISQPELRSSEQDRSIVNGKPADLDSLGSLGMDWPRL